MSDDGADGLDEVRNALEKANEEISTLRQEVNNLSRTTDRGRTSILIREIGKGYRHTVKWGVLLFLIWTAGKGVADLAGKSTDFKFLLDVPFFKVTLPFLSYLLFIAVIIMLIYVKNGWKKENEELVRKYSPYQQLEESEIDPNRSSSLLTQEGRTRPGDE